MDDVQEVSGIFDVGVYVGHKGFQKMVHQL